MILSKNNLQVVNITSVDKSIPVLNNVHITSDGTTIGANGKSIVAVSPVQEKIKKAVPLDEKIHRKSCTISSETIKEVIKNIPKDTLFKGLLEYCDFTGNKFILTDGKRKKEIESKKYGRGYIDFKKMFKQISIQKSKHRIVLNRKRLIKLLQVMDTICKDTSGESAVYIDFTENNNMVLKSVNHQNGQRVVGLMSSYKGIEGHWLDPDKWEKKLYQKKTAIKRRNINGF